MAMGDVPITVIGNIVADPELRFTPSGVGVANFRIASTPRYLDKQTQEWRDGDSVFLTCNVWRQPAENVAESLQRGMRVMVTGRLKQRSYEAKDGGGPSLRNASAKVTKSNRTGGNGQASAGSTQAHSPVADDPWSQPGDVKAGAGMSDEPPF
jgi:single-strand DNA-binding protein